MNRRAWVELNLLAALWGAVYIFTDIALRVLSPAQVVFSRVLLAAIVLTPIAVYKRAFTRILEKKWRTIVTVLAQVTMPILLLTIGQQYVDTSLAGILVGAQPIFLALLALHFARDQRPQGWLGIFGIALGFVGLALLFGFNLSSSQSFVGGLLVVASALGYAIGAIMAYRWLGDVEPIGVAASAMIVSTVVLTIPAIFLPAKSTARILSVVPEVLVLGILCTGLALAIYYSIINRLGPAKAALAFYLSPAYAVIFGLIFRNERLTVSAILGLTAIIVGSVLAADQRLRLRSENSTFVSSFRQARLLFLAAWHDAGNTIRQLSLVMWTCGMVFLSLGFWVDSTGWWANRPFLSNLSSSLASVFFGLPFALIVVQRISANEAERTERRSAIRVAVRATSHLVDATNALVPGLISSTRLNDGCSALRQALNSIWMEPWKRREYYDSMGNNTDDLADWINANRNSLIQTVAFISVTWDIWKETAFEPPLPTGNRCSGFQPRRAHKRTGDEAGRVD